MLDSSTNGLPALFRKLNELKGLKKERSMDPFQGVLLL